VSAARMPAFLLVKQEPPIGIEPMTYSLRDRLGHARDLLKPSPTSRCVPREPPRVTAVAPLFWHGSGTTC
jgi:hypothetical protein